MRPSTILVPMDFSPHSEKALEVARGTDREGARARLDERLARVRREGWTGDLHLADDRPDHAIVALARERPADLIVMGARGRTGLSDLLTGSVAERTVCLARCPVARRPF